MGWPVLSTTVTSMTISSTPDLKVGACCPGSAAPATRKMTERVARRRRVRCRMEVGPSALDRSSAFGHQPNDFPHDFLVRRELELRRSDKTVADDTTSVDEEQRRPRDVPGVEADPLPDAVGLQR